jgi:hypothetical protein
MTVTPSTPFLSTLTVPVTALMSGMVTGAPALGCTTSRYR